MLTPGTQSRVKTSACFAYRIYPLLTFDFSCPCEQSQVNAWVPYHESLLVSKTLFGSSFFFAVLNFRFPIIAGRNAP